MKQSELIKEFCQIIKDDRNKYGYSDKNLIDRILDNEGCESFKDFVEALYR